MAVKEIPHSINKVLSIGITFSDSNRWGWAPVISLLCAFGLSLVAFANMLSREGIIWADTFFWMGLIMLVLPCTLRLTSINAPRWERIALLILLGLLLYFVKVMHSPYGFNFADEYVHEYNAMQILQTGTLYSTNPIISVTPLYPGLEVVTSTLALLSGLSVFVSGLIIIGLARLILMLALYLFYEQVGGSERYAGIAAMIYASNSNFLFWSAQFSYESLTLPLVVMVLFVVARRDRARNSSEYTAFTVIALLGIAAVIISHHLSAYFLTVFLVIWACLFILGPSTLKEWFKEKNLILSYKVSGLMENPTAQRFIHPAIQGPGWLAIAALLFLSGWLIFTAGNTINYLVPVLKGAFLSVVNIINGSQAPRTLFESKTGYVAPVWQHVIGILSIALLAAGVPFGFREFWRNYRKNRVVLMLVFMGIAFFGMLGLRFSPQAWETGNRTSEYLFIGLAFLLSIGGIELWHPKRFPWIGKTIFALSVCVIFVGGCIAGWPPRLITQQPSLVKIDNFIIEPQGTAVARWFLSEFGPGNRMGADPVNARLMLSYGNQFALEGSYPDIRDIVRLPEFPDWQKEILQKFSVRYIVMDHRAISRDNMAGYFFDAVGGDQALNSPLIDQKTYDKFNRLPSVNRILDSGAITIYDFIILLSENGNK